MKTQSILIALMVLCLWRDIEAQQQNWTWQNPLPQGNTIYSIALFDENTLTVAGDAGTIMNSTNGGINWQILNTGTINSFRNAEYFQNGLIGYAVGLNSALVKTTDAGNTWTQLEIVPDYYFFAIDFIDENRGFIGGYGTALGSRIFKTTDGGLTWSQSDSLPLYHVQTIKFVDELNGFAAGWIGIDSSMYRTTDGGESWSRKDIQVQSQWDNIKSIQFISSTVGFAVGTRCILKTTDAGGNWNYIYSGTDPFNSICFPESENVGYVVGDFNIIKKTTDGGTTWQTLNTNVSWTFFYNDVSFIDDSTGYIAGSHGILQKTTDGGSSWVTLSSSISLAWHTSIDFPVSSQVGYLCGMGSKDKIFKTTNGGDNWQVQPFNISAGLRKIDFIDNDTGYIVGDNAAILKTVDGGENWNYLVNSLSRYLFDVDFPNNSNVGYVAGEYGTLAKTTDGGSTWNKIGSFTKDIYAICFPVSDQVGYVTTTYERIYKTTDGGSTWETKYDGNSPSRYINDILFPFDEQTGYALSSGGGTNSKVFKTTDGGNNWTAIDLGLNVEFISLSFPVHNIGYISGANNGNFCSTLLKTTDEGATWNLLKVPYSYSISAVCFPTNVDTGFLIGNMSGAILKTTNGGGLSTSVVDDDVNKIEYNFILNQNYPNPFNPVTNFQFTIAYSQLTILKVFDIMGREVATLVNDVKSPGTYSVQWNASQQPSGIYFCRLQSGKYSETKKLLLLK
jgi:photosystem II stability/assembly factor-like uncharacterized protein